MSDKKNNELNGMNMQMLNTVFESMRNHAEMANATFSVKSEWEWWF
jgi:hypothetical protein